jgi:CheY-like chemotaxis protein
MLPPFEHERSSRVPDPSLAGIRVLVVDDTVDSLEMLKLTLELEGAQVFAASSAAEAFDVLERETVDVLVTDLGMPRVDGYGLLRSVRKEHPDHNGYVPAVALTGFASDDDRARTLAAGFRAHLTKPVDVEALIELLRELAGRG